MVFRDGLVVVGSGLLSGLIGAYFAAPVIRAFLLGVKPADPLTLASATIILAAVTASRLLCRPAAPPVSIPPERSGPRSTCFA